VTAAAAGRGRFCIDGVDGPAACLAGVAMGRAGGITTDVGKPDRGGAALRPNFLLAKNCLNLPGLRRSLTISDVGSASSSRAVVSRTRLDALVDSGCESMAMSGVADLP
jgi:hypothetical protein